MRTIALVLVAGQLSEESHRAAFQEHKQQYHKHYSDEEELKRYEIFKQNRQFVEEYNARHTGVELGLNEFADLENDEFTQQYVGGFKPELTSTYGGRPTSGCTSTRARPWTTRWTGPPRALSRR